MDIKKTLKKFRIKNDSFVMKRIDSEIQFITSQLQVTRNLLRFNQLEKQAIQLRELKQLI